MSQAQRKTLTGIEVYIEAAEQHGRDSEPDHEVGDLQAYLRTAWSLMTAEQRAAFKASELVRDTLSTALPSLGEVLPGATHQEITEVMMQDIVGDYDTPDTVPEWKWVEQYACFGHAKNGTAGVWEFILNLACELRNVPEKLAPVIADARNNGASYLIVHQGT